MLKETVAVSFSPENIENLNRHERRILEAFTREGAPETMELAEIAALFSFVAAHRLHDCKSNPRRPENWSRAKQANSYARNSLRKLRRLRIVCRRKPGTYALTPSARKFFFAATPATPAIEAPAIPAEPLALAAAPANS